MLLIDVLTILGAGAAFLALALAIAKGSPGRFLGFGARVSVAGAWISVAVAACAGALAVLHAYWPHLGAAALLIVSWDLQLLLLGSALVWSGLVNATNACARLKRWLGWRTIALGAAAWAWGAVAISLPALRSIGYASFTTVIAVAVVDWAWHYRDSCGPRTKAAVTPAIWFALVAVLAGVAAAGFRVAEWPRWGANLGGVAALATLEAAWMLMRAVPHARARREGAASHAGRRAWTVEMRVDEATCSVSAAGGRRWVPRALGAALRTSASRTIRTISRPF